jgi:hypothetical protein
MIYSLTFLGAGLAAGIDSGQELTALRTDLALEVMVDEFSEIDNP